MVNFRLVSYILSNLLAMFLNQLEEYSKPIACTPLALFRILFGVVIVLQGVNWFSKDLITTYFVNTDYNFPYLFLDFIKPLPPTLLTFLLGVMMVAGLAVALGVYYRFSVILVTLIFGYFFLLDKSYYNNHYYLLVLIGFLLSFVNADRSLALGKKPSMIPLWQLRIFQFQIIIVYFFGGVAKLNPEWFAGEPMRTFLSMRPESALLGDLMKSEFAVAFLSYGGIIFDILIGFLLIIPRTFWLAVGGILFFNITNHWLFLGDIGVFPLFMIGATVLFVPEAYYKKIFKSKIHAPETLKKNSQKWVLGFFGVYFLIQLFLPLRHFLYPGNPEWTGEGHRFAWRMKMMHRKASVKFAFRDLESDRRYPVDLQKVLGPGQLRKLNYSPEMIVQFAHFIKKEMIAAGIKKPIILTDYQVSWNSKPFQPQFSTQQNLADIELSPWSRTSWLLPYNYDRNN